MTCPVVALDAYPLLEPAAGVGRYVDQLIDSLVALPDGPSIVLPTTSMRSSGAVRRAGAITRHRRLPMRLVHALWERGDWPPGELVTGPVDVFHATNFVAPPMRRTPVVVTVHDLADERLPATVDHRVARLRDTLPRLVERSARVIALTDATADEIRTFFSLDAERVVTIPNGVSPAWFSPADVAIPESWRGAIVAVGMGNPRKNLPLLLEVKRRAGDALPPLVVVGQHTTATAAVEGVTFTGRIDDDLLMALVAAASVVAVPSALEGFGLPIIEALAAGTPVVASDLPVHREVGGPVIRYASVPTEPWRDERSTVEEWIAALGAPPLGHRPERQDRARTFTWTRCAEAHAALYRDVAGG